MTDFFEGADQAAAKIDLENKADPATQVNATVDLSMIGDGKKYRSVEDADKALYHQEQHIKKVEEDNARLKAAAEKHTTLEDVKAILSNNKQEGSQAQATSGTQTDNATMTADAVKEAAKRVYFEEGQRAREESNRLAVANQLVKTYGTEARAKEVLVAKARELDMTVEKFQAWAKESPKAVLEILIPKGNPAPTSGFTPSSQSVSNNTQVASIDYKELKKLSKGMKDDELTSMLANQFGIKP